MQKKSNFEIMDLVSRRKMQFIPKRVSSMFETKQPTYHQFFEDIKHLGNVAIFYKNRLISVRGL